MATQGRELMAQTLALANQVRSRLEACSPLQVLQPEPVATGPGQFQLDPTRLTVDVSTLGITGFVADEFLHEQLGVTAELPTLRQLTFILSLGNTQADGDRLVAALQTLMAKAPELRATERPAMAMPDWSLPRVSTAPMTPRDAFFARTRALPAAAAVGHISADILCPYPPGIPLLLPGEVITAAAIATLQEIQAAGGVITGSADPTLQTLRIVDIG
jgi:arginine/lysine/ornithine decarboxylase